MFPSAGEAQKRGAERFCPPRSGGQIDTGPADHLTNSAAIAWTSGLMLTYRPTVSSSSRYMAHETSSTPRVYGSFRPFQERRALVRLPTRLESRCHQANLAS